MMECSGGYVVPDKSWAKYLLDKMNFVRWKATTKRPKSQYQILRN